MATERHYWKIPQEKMDLEQYIEACGYVIDKIGQILDEKIFVGDYTEGKILLSYDSADSIEEIVALGKFRALLVECDVPFEENKEQNDLYRATLTELLGNLSVTSSTRSRPSAVVEKLPLTASYHELQIPKRAEHACERLSCKTIGDIVEKREEDFLAIKNCGQIAVNIMKAELAKHGYSFATYGPTTIV